MNMTIDRAAVQARLAEQDAFMRREHNETHHGGHDLSFCPDCPNYSPPDPGYSPFVPKMMGPLVAPLPGHPHVGRLERMRALGQSLADYWRRLRVDEIPATDPAAVEVCATCHDVGFVRRQVAYGHADFGQAFPCPECGLNRERLRQAARLPLKFRDWTLDGWEVLVPGHDILRQRAAEWLTHDSAWMFLWGPAGRGKTRIAVGILHEWWQLGKSGDFVDVADLLKRVQESYDPESPERESVILQPYYDVALLVLDDLGVENPTDWATKKLFQLVNHRYNNSLRTIATSNYALDRLSQMHRSERLPSRIREMAGTHFVLDVSKLPNMRVRD